MKVLGPIFGCVALSLMGFATYTFFVHALPLMEAGLAEKVGLSVVGVFLLGNTLYNYGNSICRDAGCPPEFERVRDEMQLEAEELGSAPPRKCNQCQRLKPARAHHCSICRRCVLKMDHHCPWINNCVGHGNYRYFCLFMLFLWLSCLFVISTFLYAFSPLIFHLGRRIGTREARQCITTTFMLCCSILVALLILGGFHMFLVLSNQSTIEFQTNVMHRKEARKNGEFFRNPYDLGRSRNFQQVFGPNAFWRFLWLFPYLNEPPTGHGLQFPSLSRLRV
mmetsp:Transcript_94023/g.244890  ORF Transcript_94023/g.244890 Transcript_94023/m.244890 type:complete len:279 (-) Transcript_94023:46-882(-)